MDTNDVTILQALSPQKKPKALSNADLFDFFPEAGLLTLPFIKNILDFPSHFSRLDDPITEEVLDTCWRSRELLRSYLERLQQSSRPFQEKQKLYSTVIDLAKNYAKHFDIVDHTLCTQGLRCLSSSSSGLLFSWQSFMEEGPREEDDILTFKNATAFEGLMIRATIAILYSLQAKACIRELKDKWMGLGDAATLFDKSAIWFHECARFSKSRIHHIPISITNRQFPIQCLDKKLYKSLQNVAMASTLLCRCFDPVSDISIEYVDASFLFHASQFYEKALGALRKSQQTHVYFYQSIWRTWRCTLLTCFLRAAETLFADKTKTISRHATAISVGTAVYFMLEKERDKESLCQRVQKWEEYYCKLNNEIYMVLIPNALEGGDVTNNIVESLLPYLLYQSEPHN